MTALVEVKDLSIAFGNNQVVNGISFSIDAGETVALVGEYPAKMSTMSLDWSKIALSNLY